MRVIGTTLFAAMLAMSGTATQQVSHHAVRKASSYRFPETGVLGPADLIQLAILARLDQGHDQFTTSRTNLAIGRKFEFTQHMEEDTAGGMGTGAWSYDRGKSEMGFYIDRSIKKDFVVSYQRHPSGAYIGQNSFGVKRRVTKFDVTTVQVTPGAWPNVDNNGYNISVPVASGDEARRLTKDVVLLIDGVVMSEDSKAASCEESRSGATLDDPTDEGIMTCTIHADITSLAFIDEATGKTLGKWNRLAPPDR